MFMKTPSGLTLVEVLVTLIVLAFGLLGLVALQTSGLRYNYDAYLRTRAIFLANDIIDRMRANKDAAVAGSYNMDIDAPPPSGVTDCRHSACDASQLVAFDKAMWKCLVGQKADICDELNVTPLLPEGRGKVEQPVTDDKAIVRVEIRWRRRESFLAHAGGGEEARVVLKVRL